MELIRPFFSVIIPCYNSRKTLGRLLQSIVNQNMYRTEIEVVLSDDHSTESYEDVVDQFKNRLNIVRTQTDYNCCPGNTRQRGVQAASGRWIVFSDHDDQFFPNVFPIVKKEIEKSKCDTVYETRFVKVHTDGAVEQMRAHMGWTHGRFFNLDNYWNKYGLHYIKDLTSHEDVSISTQMNVISSMNPDLVSMEGNFNSYKWIEKEDSLSNRKYVDENNVPRGFLDLFYIDYLTSTAGVYYDAYQNGKIKKDFAYEQLKEIVLYAYFYSEYNIIETPNYLVRNYDQIHKYLNFMQQELGISIYQFLEDVKEDKRLYADVFQKGLIATGFIIYEHTLKQWLEMVYNGEY